MRCCSTPPLTTTFVAPSARQTVRTASSHPGDVSHAFDGASHGRFVASPESLPCTVAIRATAIAASVELAHRATADTPNKPIDSVLCACTQPCEAMYERVTSDALLCWGATMITWCRTCAAELTDGTIDGWHCSIQATAASPLSYRRRTSLCKETGGRKEEPKEGENIIFHETICPWYAGNAKTYTICVLYSSRKIYIMFEYISSWSRNSALKMNLVFLTFFWRDVLAFLSLAFQSYHRPLQGRSISKKSF